MTQEEKAKAYDEAFERAKKVFNCDANDREPGTSICEYIFPVLKESEDEKIRKEIIKYIKGTFPNEFSGIESKNKWIAWLEKQTNHANFCNNIQIGDKVTRNMDGVLVNLSQLNRVAKKDENQDEQKSGDNIVEPKFKIGDWIIYSNEEVHLITDFDDNGYFVDNKEFYIPFNCEGNMRLWTIQDAKDGDVLTSISFHSNCTFIFNGLDNWKFDGPNGDRAVATGYCCLSASADNMEFGIKGPDCIEVDTVKPATKEQRDLLFSKMKESDYKWDSEKKELKKIEHKPACSDDKKLTDVNHEYFSELLENNNSEDINDYAYQVAYCMSHDWANEAPTWDDVQKACKLGAEWNEKHMKRE